MKAREYDEMIITIVIHNTKNQFKPLQLNCEYTSTARKSDIGMHEAISLVAAATVVVPLKYHCI